MLTKPGLAFHNAVIQVSFRLGRANGITLDANSFGSDHRGLGFERGADMGQEPRRRRQTRRSRRAAAIGKASEQTR